MEFNFAGLLVARFQSRSSISRVSNRIPSTPNLRQVRTLCETANAVFLVDKMGSFACLRT